MSLLLLLLKPFTCCLQAFIKLLLLPLLTGLLLPPLPLLLPLAGCPLLCGCLSGSISLRFLLRCRLCLPLQQLRLLPRNPHLLLQLHPFLFHPPNSLLFLLDQPQAQLTDFGLVPLRQRLTLTCEQLIKALVLHELEVALFCNAVGG